MEEGLQDRADDPVNRHHRAAVAGNLVGALELHLDRWNTPHWNAELQDIRRVGAGPSAGRRLRDEDAAHLEQRVVVRGGVTVRTAVEDLDLPELPERTP